MAKTRNMKRTDSPFLQSMCVEHNYDHDIFVDEYPWWWLSFSDPARPKGKQFLGGALVQGRDIGQLQRHYIALHGLRNVDLPSLGFEEITDDA